MKTKRYLFILMIFVLALTAACGGSGDTPAPPADVPVEAPPAEEPAPVEEAPAEEPAAEPITTEFPLPEDAANLMEVGDGTLNFQTALSIPDVVTFYRFAFPDYTEREVVTVVEDGSFNIVFDGHASGKAIVIQGFPMGDGVNVNIRLEDI
ncbi:MAG: hypothetical protein HN391_12765 [Anaerolineae bacterium]|jgi:hypothetical protein|nr:hypothetical protein [Anaerolineae bacterium]